MKIAIFVLLALVAIVCARPEDKKVEVTKVTKADESASPTAKSDSKPVNDGAIVFKDENAAKDGDAQEDGEEGEEGEGDGLESRFGFGGENLH